MTNISTIHAAMITRIEALLPSHARLSNAYKIDENADLYLSQGYGLALGEGSNTERQVGCKLSIQRTFRVTLTRQFYALELDGEAKATTEKQLFEDQLLLINGFETDATLQSSAIRAVFVSDGGIEYVYGEKDNFLMLQSIFTAEYFETLT